MAEQRFGGDLRVYGKAFVETQGTEANAVVVRTLLNSSITDAKSRASHTGTQLFATISDGQTILDARIAEVVGLAPAALDTLGEIADALTAGDTAAVALTAQVATNRTDLDATTARVTAAETNITDLRGDVDSLSGAAGGLASKAALDAATARLTATELVANAAATAATVAALDTRVSSVEALAAAAVKQVDFDAAVVALTAADAALDARIDSLELPTIFKATVGDGALSVLPVTHGLNSTDVELIVRDLTDGQKVFPVDIVTDANTVNLDFGSFVPAANSIRVIVKAL